jgi:HSP20 family protein
MTLPARFSRRPAGGWDPFRELDDLYDRMSRLWQTGGGSGLERWSPPADVEETDDAWVVELDVPGVDRDDIDIQLNDRELAITGEVQEKERTGVLRRQTRRVGQFRYAVTLPGDVDGDGVTAQLKDGVLEVRVPKAQQAQPRRITISS